MATKQKLARKAVKSTAKHSAHGTVSKLKREPARAAALLVLGALAGALLGWLLARSSRGSGGSDESSPQPPAPTIPPLAPTPTGGVS
ncbi:MAG: hypothetical protein ACOYD4_14195 [Solirubrobacterales bacterium]